MSGEAGTFFVGLSRAQLLRTARVCNLRLVVGPFAILLQQIFNVRRTSNHQAPPEYGMRSLLATAPLWALAQAATREIYYDITTARGNPDGLLDREVLTVNGSWP